MADSVPQRPKSPRKSFKERFWSVSAANQVVEKDRDKKREQKREQDQQQSGPSSPSPYVPTHAASDHLKTASPSRHNQGQRKASVDSKNVPSDDYSTFVSQEEARDIARQMYGDSTATTQSPPPKRKHRNSVVKRIAEYIKPSREEGGP